MPVFTSASLTSFLVAVSFAAGLNVYATTAMLGLGQRLHWIDVPAGLSVLATTPAIVASLVLFLLELVGDKIPYVDLVWNAAHTFIRIPVAALMAYRAAAPLPPAEQALVTVLAASVAGVAHATKSSGRLIVSASPEPVSNIVLSAMEDVAAVALTWFATHHPYVAGSVATALVIAAVILCRKMYLALRRGFAQLRSHFAGSQPTSY